MKKAINLYFYKADTKEKLDLIKKAGFDGVILGVYEGVETMSLKDQVEYCNKIGLGISMIHCSYIEPKLNGLWYEDSVDGDYTENDYIQQIEAIKDYGVKDFIIHTNGGFDTICSKAGLNRIRNMLKVCEKYNINLCIENLYTEEQVNYIFQNFQSENLKFCYDCGHNNFLTPNSLLLEHYADKLTTTHIHDNYGDKDDHIILGEGNIDIDKLAEKLSKCDFEYLSAEVKFKDKNIEEILKRTLDSLENLDNKINEYKNKNA